MRIAQDPLGKFYIARSIYKTILRFVNSNHGTRYVVQPLAPQNFSVTQNQGVALLSWTAQLDKTEPSARPTSYIIYKAEGQGGFDNGTIVNTTRCQMQLKPGKLYHLRWLRLMQEEKVSPPKPSLCSIILLPASLCSS